MSQHSRHNDLGALGVNLGLIITPMLDMSFQILSFFIMTYNPSMLEGQVSGSLTPPAEVKSGGPKTNEAPQILDVLPDLEDAITVTVLAVPKGSGKDGDRVDGEPTEIYVKRIEDKDKTFVAGPNEPLDASLKKLKDKLVAFKGAGAKSVIRLDCHLDMKHQYVLRLYDACKDAGYPNVSFAAPAPEKNEK